MTTNLTRSLVVALALGGTLLIAGAASAASATTAQRTDSASDSQTISIPTDNVLLALAAGGSPSIGDVANIHRSTTASSAVSSNANIATNDALLALALGNGGSTFAARSLLLGTSGFGLGSLGTFGSLGTLGTFGTFGTLGSLGTLGTFGTLGVGNQARSVTTTRVVDQTVSFNPDTVLAALALGHGSVLGSSVFGINGFTGFGGFGGLSNFHRTVTDTTSATSNVALDSNSVLATLALGG